MTPPRLYLPGPDVFLREARDLARDKQAICERHGLVGLAPVDSVPQGAAPDAPAIFAACLAMMREADAIVANLTPFRGISADPGTIFELGFMAAAGKPLYGYSNVTTPIGERVAQAFGPVTQDPSGHWAADGMIVESFDLSDNLMIDEALGLFGRRIVTRAVAPGRELTDLGAFEACIALVATDLKSRLAG